MRCMLLVPLLLMPAALALAVTEWPEAAVPLKGTVMYQGTSGGDVVTQSRRDAQSSEMTGAIALELKFEGQAVDAVFKTTQAGLRHAIRETGACAAPVHDSGLRALLRRRAGVNPCA